MPIFEDEGLWSNFKNKCIKNKSAGLKNISQQGKELLVDIKQKMRNRKEPMGNFKSPDLNIGDFVLEKGSTLGIDKLSDRKLSKGKYEIDYRLDLHGMTLEAAHNRIRSAFNLADKNNFKCLLIITGKGLHSKNKTIKESVIDWFREPYFANKIIKYVDAHRSDGGSGALYVLLRSKD